MKKRPWIAHKIIKTSVAITTAVSDGEDVGW